jgi:hypothetical protein
MCGLPKPKGKKKVAAANVRTGIRIVSALKGMTLTTIIEIKTGIPSKRPYEQTIITVQELTRRGDPTDNCATAPWFLISVPVGLRVLVLVFIIRVHFALRG